VAIDVPFVDRDCSTPPCPPVPPVLLDDPWDDDSFIVDVDRPASPTLELRLDGLTGTGTLPPGFAITVPAHVTTGRVDVAFEVLPNARPDPFVFVKSRCTARSEVSSGVVSSPGILALDLAPLADAGHCEHELHIDQQVPAQGGTLYVVGVRLGLVAFSSDP
jgi:hypothetical protein